MKMILVKRNQHHQNEQRSHDIEAFMALILPTGFWRDRMLILVLQNPQDKPWEFFRKEAISKP